MNHDSQPIESYHLLYQYCVHTLCSPVAISHTHQVMYLPDCTLSGTSLVPPLYKLEINKNLKFKKGVGIAIKSKETSSKLAI